VRAWRIRHRKDTLVPYEKKTGPKTRYKDEGLALFTGSDTVPCSSSLHSFDYGMKEATLRGMKTFYIEILKKYMDLSVRHIDFHMTPHFGDSREMETNHIATRGKNMKGALIFLFQDRESRIFPYSNANVRMSEASGEVKKILDMVKPLGIKPEWIIIDSKVTDYKNIAKISDEGAKIVTLRYRSKEVVEAVEHIEDWEVVRIKRAKGGYAKIRAHEKPVTLRYKDDDEKGKKLEMREVIVTDNGREKPMFIITTDFEHSMKDIIELYPPRWLIELGIKTETKFFYLNQLASDLDIKLNFDTFLTQIAHSLYRLMAMNLRGYESAEPETLYKEFVQGWGRIYNYKDKIIVCLSKKRSTGCLINAPFLDGWVDGGKYISWLGKKLEFVWM
jgi:hypothetical protein